MGTLKQFQHHEAGRTRAGLGQDTDREGNKAFILGCSVDKEPVSVWYHDRSAVCRDFAYHSWDPMDASRSDDFVDQVKPKC